MGITDRIDAVTAIPEKYRAAVIPAPKACKIELTGKCNYRCSFCSHGNLEAGRTSEIDRNLYRRLLREMVDYGVEELGVFYIGESFTCKWLPDAIREAKEAGFSYVFLTTNGSLAKPDMVEACMHAGLDSLKFSINNADPLQFQRVTGVAGKWHGKALDNLKAARRIRDQGGYSCGLYASSIAYDGMQGERMAKVIERDVLPYVDQHYYLPLFEFGGVARDREEADGMAPVVGNPGRLGMMRDPLPCWSVFTEAHITSDGHLNACCFGGDDTLSMADLNTTSFADGWNSAAFQDLRRAHLARDVRGTGCMQCMARTQ